jgi:hypothetical protein
MRLDKIWCVTDPTRESTPADVCFETTLAGMCLQFKGGLTMAMNPTLFTSREEAEAEAHLRLVAMRAGEAIRDAAPEKAMKDAARVAILDGDGKTLFEAALSWQRR